MSRTQTPGYEGNAKMGKLDEKSTWIEGKRTDLELLSSRKIAGISSEVPPRPTKLLLNVTLERSIGAVQVVMSPELKVGDLVAAAVKQYVKEGRRPLLLTTNPSGFNLHYSQFSLESLDREEKLLALGSRNFFMCHTKDVSTATSGAATTTSSFTLCSSQVEKSSKIVIPPWLRFMDFLM